MKRIIAIIIMMLCLVGCGSASVTDTASTTATTIEEEVVVEEASTVVDTEPVEDVMVEEAVDEPQPAEVPEGMYLSELTGEPISEDLREQRPIAVMVDNDERALPHYGTARADVVYEMVNSTANNRITRLMCLYKDWQSVPQIGSIRSLRPTNILLAQEWDAVICHDGGPYYINSYLSRYPDHFSGNFSRVSNGKAREFTEYILSGDLNSKFSYAGFASTYGEDVDPHFHFVEYGLAAELEPFATSDTVRPAEAIIQIPFPHNKAELHYNAETEEYEYWEYGAQHQDAGTGEVMSFTNVILQNADLQQLDSNGYCIYDCINVSFGYYITRGELISIVWRKTSESDVTRYYDTEGNEIDINTGKTYIALVPSDVWDDLEIY